MDDLKLETVDDDDMDGLIEAIHQGFDAVPLPDDIEPFRSTPFAFALRNDRGEIEGAVTGRSVWGWLYVKYLWVSGAYRGQGFGKHLLDTAENTARDRGCSGVWLSTFSFQAGAFYERQGYEKFGELPDMPKGHRRLFYRKTLNHDQAR
ncbi:MAG: GNAT family N-acetyltransferase [Pseudomonadota bacterium]